MKEKFLFGCEKEVKHYEGLELRDGASCIIRLSNLNLQLCDAKRRPILNISLKDITNVGIISDKELVEKDRSVIGRGIVGSALFGGAGLILGGLSGVSKKQVEQNIDYLVINYKSNDNDKVISVYAKEDTFDSSFMKELNYAVEKSKQELKCPNCGNVINFNDFKCPVCKKIIKNEKNANKVSIIAVIIFFFVVFSIIMGITNTNNKDIKIIKESINVDEKQAENIDYILNEVGLNKFESIEADIWLNDYEGAGSKGYRIKTDFSDNVILYIDSNNSVICIRYADEDYYRNGQVLKKFE
ncbi:MAG: hypothetical protein ACI4VL_06505 [Bacilli bacterium]